MEQEWQDNNEITTAMTTTATTLNVAPKISKKIINMKDSKIIEIPELEIQETLEPEEIPEPEIQEISEENPAIVINLDKIQPAFRQKYRRFDDIDRPCQLCDGMYVQFFLYDNKRHLQCNIKLILFYSILKLKHLAYRAKDKFIRIFHFLMSHIL